MPDEGVARIDEMIVTVRGQRVILGDDLARIYGVETRVLNQAVRRNADKFPSDFIYQVTREEAKEAQRLRSQIVIFCPADDPRECFYRKGDRVSVGRRRGQLVGSPAEIMCPRK